MSSGAVSCYGGGAEEGIDYRTDGCRRRAESEEFFAVDYMGDEFSWDARQSLHAQVIIWKHIKHVAVDVGRGRPAKKAR